ncbi:CRISPR-associated endonuclease Cas6 [Clostridium sp. USBA 49]|uniref:CRISPR-associated endonuclease Cas6 n=1 Tax=Clostridium sp. USBA 49 TaxID=1881060 RepID=UPI0015D8B903|nr:CRISPR-associated endonuclease Cas6 [Clostridium sp. USBA 49]
MELKILKLSFGSLEIARRDIPKIRGFISSNYPQYDELHNHKGDKFIYRYPLIQYKTIDGNPVIIGIEEGADILSSIENNIDFLNIFNKRIDIYEKGIFYKKFKFGVSDKLLQYKFISPWLSLNERNFIKYISCLQEEKIDILKKILIGNILSMSKRFNYTVENKLEAYINLKPCKINFKNQEMIGFKGEFLINFQIPDYMAIGKSVSRGFGTVKLVKNFDFK